MPLLLLLFGGGLVLGLAMYDRQVMTWTAQEAALAAAGAGAEDTACEAAVAVAAAATGRTFTDCAGADGLAMQYAPADDPPMVTITLDGSTWHPPMLEPVTIRGRAVAVIREPAP